MTIQIPLNLKLRSRSLVVKTLNQLLSQIVVTLRLGHKSSIVILIQCQIPLFLQHLSNYWLHEIEATPKEYWGDLLVALRQARQKIPTSTESGIDAEQAAKNQAAIDLLDSWLSEDASEDQQTWKFLKTALDEDRLSDRPLFP